MRKLKKLLKYLPVLVLFFSSGCSSAENLENNFNQLNVLGNTAESPYSNQERADRIKTEILKINGITAAHVVVTNHTALIGLQMEYDTFAEVSRLKKEASKRAKETDSEIKNTSITNNEEIFAMIGELEEKKNTASS